MGSNTWSFIESGTLYESDTLYFVCFLTETWLGVERGLPTFGCLLKVIRDWAILQWNSNIMEGSISFLYTV